MTDDAPQGPRRPGALAALLVGAALAFAGFVALGMWQLQRLAWKQDLIARLDQRLHAEPAAAPGPADWPAVDAPTAEYRRVQARGRFAHEQETTVRASTELGTGYWVLTPLRTDGGWWLIVNRGFVPSELRGRATRAATEPAGEQVVTGLLRITEPGGSLLQRNEPQAGRWYSRDVQAIATAHGLGSGPLAGPVAPYFVDTAASPTAAPWPRPGLTIVHFNNSHRAYALTWFAMAFGTALAAGYMLRDEQRLRRALRDGAGARP